MSTGGIAGLSLLAQTAQFTTCLATNLVENKSTKCIPCVAPAPVEDDRDKYYTYECPLCARVVLKSKKYLDYHFLRPTVVVNNSEHRKFMRHARQHCKEKHPNFWAWNLLPNPSLTVIQKNMDSKVDFLICLSLMNGAKEYPLDTTEEAYKMDHRYASLLFVYRCTAARLWLRWIYPRRMKTINRLDKSLQKSMTKKVDSILSKFITMKETYYCSMYYINAFNNCSPVHRINELQLLCYQPGRYRKRSLFLIPETYNNNNAKKLSYEPNMTTQNFE